MVFTDNGKMSRGKICILSIPKCTLRNVVDATRMVDLCLFCVVAVPSIGCKITRDAAFILDYSRSNS
jgi:hypothetical protein